jgi:hypothetical protein
MIAIQGDNGKKIQFTLSDVVHKYEDDVYIIEMPIVVCNNKKDAELIQEEVGTFVAELSKTILLKNE